MCCSVSYNATRFATVNCFLKHSYETHAKSSKLHSKAQVYSIARLETSLLLNERIHSLVIGRLTYYEKTLKTNSRIIVNFD